MIIPLFAYYKIVSKILQNHHTNKNKYRGHRSEDRDARVNSIAMINHDGDW